MIDFIDRSVQFPNRYRMTKVAGTDDIFNLLPAPGEVTEEGTFVARRAAQLLQADIRTHPIAPGNTVSVGDVVDVVGGAATKAGTPSQAIALQSGTAGQNIDIIYDGVAEAPGITAGTQITSLGVRGYAPQSGWLWVKPEWDTRSNVISGYYIGTGTSGSSNKNTLMFDFIPKMLFVTQDGMANRLGVLLYQSTAGIMTQAQTTSTLFADTTVSWGGKTVSWYSDAAAKQANSSGITYRYVAIG